MRRSHSQYLNTPAIVPIPPCVIGILNRNFDLNDLKIQNASNHLMPSNRSYKL